MNPFFVNNFFGLYHKVIGLGLNGVIKTQLPQLKKVMTPEEYQWISNVLATNNDGLRHLDRHIYVKMFGYKDLQDYYDKVSLCNAIDAIKVPTFAFGAVDDNLCHDACIPRAKMQAKGSNVFLATSTYGAHATHLSGTLKITPWC